VRLIDTHVHFWDQRRADMHYPWLEAAVPHPILGDIDEIKSPLYDLKAFVAETRFAEVVKVVHVEADARGISPTSEPDWVRSISKQQLLPIAIVVHTDLGAHAGISMVDQFADLPDVAGVRDFGVVRYLDDPTGFPHFDASLTAMEETGLLLDLDCDWEHMALAKELADAHPQLRIVLEHLGFPRRRDSSYFADWLPRIAHLATANNVYCKLSGLGMTDPRWTVDSLRPWVSASLDAFGPSRCLFGSNWPVDRIASSYDSLVSAFLELISGYREGEQEAICSTNAEELYFTGK
jgi:predicted TIM-barrel fold metal-dependent hydrolase